MGDVVQLDVATLVDEPADQILEKAKGQGLKQCIIVGWDDEDELWMSGSTSDPGVIALLLLSAQHWLGKEQDR